MEFHETLDRMHNGRLYYADDGQLGKEQALCLEKLYDFNASRPSEGEKREKLLREMFAEIGEGCYIEPPLHANWGGKHVHFGKGIYANFNLTLVDDTHIYVGDQVMFGPNVVVCTGTHPILPELRDQQVQYNLPIRIGAHAWIGAGAILLPGVTVGEGAIIGAGSVVTKDIPDRVVAAGSPCRILRPVGEEDRKYFDRGKAIDLPL